MDSDLAESISAIKEALTARKLNPRFGKAEAELVTALKSKLRLPRRYREFLLAADPLKVETRTPSESIRLLPSAELLQEQKGFCLDDRGELIAGALPNGWRPSWVIIAHSSLLGDPYFLDTAGIDAEGDCPVYSAMSGTEQWKARLCASSFALFLRILAIGLETAADFAEEDVDMDDEQVFRDTFGPRIRQYDPAAAKAGHWT